MIGNFCTIGQNVFISGKAKIGNYVKVQNNVSIYDNVILEDYVFCGPSVIFTNVYNPRSEINRKNAKRLLSKNDEKWNTLPKAYNEIDNLRSKYEDENDAERLKLLEELNNFLMQ